MSAKRKETREARLGVLISRSERHEGIPPLKSVRVRARAGRRAQERE